MTCKPGRPSAVEQLAQAEDIPPERYPEIISRVRESDPAAYFALLAEAIAGEDWRSRDQERQSCV